MGYPLVDELQKDLAIKTESHMIRPTRVVTAASSATGMEIDDLSHEVIRKRYIDNLTKGSHRVLICKWKDCQMMCSNICWISTETNGDYQCRCPGCGAQFRPNASGDHLVGATYALTLEGEEGL